MNASSAKRCATSMANQNTDLVMLVKRSGIDKTWTVAPYSISSREHAGKLAAFLRKAWSIPFEWKVV